ncbi:ABC transporter ATP-binding protein [Clostridium sp. 'deep sea']|uniref:energy-coupling factor ABC transporter ATP-binding protein n=1 Tax=Clostridium sp. 'deep sea' TaxID=2779445 RepID=UPI0018969B01|nr:ABC transporter ATP-binding protein [Clostridium sp. 'deep sea']QOR35407.1 ABC transporter ATP-binding protein [Clostridium sp. 'deep sea']
MSFITLQNVNYNIKNNQILKNINLQLFQDQFTALIGHNGSGKTTLGKVIVAIIKAEGTVVIDSQNISSLTLPDIGRKIGYLFQNPNRQIFAPTVIEELTFVNRFCSAPISKEQVDDMLNIFDLNHLTEAKTYFLSQGEKQRLALATIMLNKPKYLILDEPTTGLDSLRKQQLSILLGKMTSLGIGTLMISHDSEFINKHATRTIELSKGEIINDTN